MESNQEKLDQFNHDLTVAINRKQQKNEKIEQMKFELERVNQCCSAMNSAMEPGFIKEL